MFSDQTTIGINGIIKIPGDKSCSIRSILFASQCIGISKIKNLLESEDVLTCINTLRYALGVKILKRKNISKGLLFIVPPRSLALLLIRGLISNR